MIAHWWENLLSREKMAFGAGALALGLLLIYLLIQPLLSKRTRLRDEVSSRRAELTWMREAAKEIAQSAPAAPQGVATAPPLQIIDQAARENHLSAQLKRLEPGSNGEIKVWLNNAAHVDLIRWLRQLSATGRLAITNLNIEKGSASGLVNAQLTLTSSSETP
jgi:general secretion pathway protein M